MGKAIGIAIACLGLVAGCVFDEAGVLGDDGLSQSRRKQIDIRGQVGSTLENFPVAVSFDIDADLAANANPDGSDLLFTDADGLTILPFEIEKYDSSTGALAAWVMVPKLDPFEGATVFLYYDDSNAVTQADAFDTWSDAFAGVWHMTATEGALDSSRRANHGFAPSAIVAPKSSPGVVGDALEFSAVSSHMVTVHEPADDSLDFGADSYSLSLWVEVDRSVGDRDRPWSKGATSTAEPGYNVSLGSGDWNANISSQGTLYSGSFGQESQFLGSWTHLVLVVDREDRVLRTYTNGAQVDEVDIGFMGPIENGMDATLGGPPFLFNGRVDEVRVYGAALSDSWILAEYDNLSDPGQFLRVGIEDRL